MEKNILDHIGRTPLVPIRHMNPNTGVRILAKLEYMNPGGSVKDRAALYMIKEGERSGRLTRDKIVLEATSGNTGIGLALVCAVKGYRLLLAMSEAVSQERRKILAARGAQILLTPGHLGTDGAIEEVYRLARENPEKYFMTDQFNNPANWMAHYETTGPEILADAGSGLKAVVATMGTSGTLMGMSRFFKEKAPGVRIIGVEPYLGHKIQGLKNMKEAYVPEIFEKSRLDEKINIEDELAYETARRLAKEEGLFVGMSSGAAMAIAIEVARKMEGGTVVVLLPDSGERYLSTALFTVRRKVDMSLFNPRTRQKEPFEPAQPGKVQVYTIGPTAHDRMSLSECRRLVLADILCRYLAEKDAKVSHIVPITDLDDKTIAGSQEARMEHAAFCEERIREFYEDCRLLSLAPASAYPRTTEHIEAMSRLAKTLQERGVAYEKLRSLYFDISRLNSYGQLSGVNLDKMRLGATVDLDEYEKDNPRDFTLFKRTRMADLKRGLFVKTPWGNARPSWHLQGAAMALETLGENFDIHVGSRHLAFPHHENENAIALAATGKPLARFWVDCEAVYLDDKMAGGQGGPRLTLPDLLEQGWTAREIRYWLVSTHYRRPLACSPKHLENARAAIARLDRFVLGLKELSGGSTHKDTDQFVYDIRSGFSRAMDDDLSANQALASLFGGIKAINPIIAQKALDEDGCTKILQALEAVDRVLGLLDLSGGKDAPDPEAQKLMAQREQARKDRNFALADQLREKLLALGVPVRDEPVKK
jgi:cysteinyl-tRNA synthetase